jgi:drug/metabolite transporter (DMT)-like permease
MKTLLGVGAIFLWSCLPVMAKWLDGIPPMQVNMLGLMGGGLGFYLLMALRRIARSRNVAPSFTFRGLSGRVAVMGIACYFGFHYCYFYALQHAPAVEAFLLIELWPVLLMLALALALGEPVKLRHIAGAAMGLFGVVLAIQAGDHQPEAEATGLGMGHAAAALASLIWAGYSVFARKYASAIPVHAVAVFCLGGGMLAGVAHGAYEDWAAPSATQWLVLGLMAAGPLGGAFFLWNEGMKHGNAMLLGLLALAIPVAGTCLLIAFGFSSMSPAIAVAAAMVAGGGMVGAGIGRKKKAA